MGQRTTSVYNVADQQLATIDAAGNRTTNVYDATGRQVAQKNPLSERTTSLFDAAGQQTALVNELGNRHSFTYDAAGGQTQQIDALDRRTTLAYDAARQQTLRPDARGDRTTYAYDQVGRVSHREYPDGSRVTFAYDPTGNRTSMKDKTGEYKYSYEPIGRMASAQNPQNRPLTYTYDQVGNRESMDSAAAGRFTYMYDSANQNTMVLNPFSERTTLSYDASGRQTERRMSNGTRTSLVYDANDRQTNVDNLTSSGAAIETFAYEYDSVGNPTSRVESSGDRTTWTYDVSNRLLSERRSGANSYANTFTYDSAENRTVKNEDSARTTYVYDTANQLDYSQAAGGRTTYLYDQNGNQRVEQPPAGARTTVTWDYENQPTEYQLPSGSRMTLTYNADNRRVEKETSSGLTQFIWDAALDAYHAELDGSDSLQAVYTNPPVPFGNLISQRRGTTSHWYHPDSLGSTWALTDSSETTTDTYLVDAWGNPLSSTGTTINPFRWVGSVGYYFDPETGLYYIRARVYQPTIARWTSVDPLFYLMAKEGVIWFTYKYRQGVGLEGNRWSVYVYCFSSPLDRSDPLGLRADYLCELWPQICGYNARDPHGCALVGMIRNPEYTPTRNGCTLVSDGFIGQGHMGYFTSACNNHDDCWQKCGTSFETCNRRFLDDMYSECEALRNSYPVWYPPRWIIYRNCRNWAYIYYQAVSQMRWYWRSNQRKACLPVQKCCTGDYIVGDSNFVPWEEFESDHGVAW